MSRIDPFLSWRLLLIDGEWGGNILVLATYQTIISFACPRIALIGGPNPLRLTMNDSLLIRSFLLLKSCGKSLKWKVGAIFLKEKFRLLKARLKWWNDEVFGRLDLDVKDEVKEVNLREYMLEDDAVDGRTDIVGKRKKATSRFRLDLIIKENMLIQRG